jgi:ribulose 1,5-bisphosphate synthetase/thiazole synthase
MEWQKKYLNCINALPYFYSSTDKVMQITQQHTSVLIIGAGPSGLMMAAQLLRYGVQPVIIDSKQGPTDKSKALAVQARSMEIFRQMGVIDKVINRQ